MSDEYCVDAADVRGKQLEPELRRSVNQQSAIPMPDQRSDTRSLIPGIVRAADFAPATDLWNSEARAGSQEGEPQTVSTLRRLVVPGISKGTPAVTMIGSPGEASSRVTTVFFACTIISS